MVKSGGDRARVVYVNVNTMNEKPGMTFSEAYSAKVAAVVGVVHIICGLTALAGNTIGIMCGANIPLAAGIWSSVFFVASGSLAIAGDGDHIQLGGLPAPPHIQLLPCREQKFLLSVRFNLEGNRDREVICTQHSNSSSS